MMQLTITTKLLIALLLGLLCIFAGQVITRTAFELPQLRKLEFRADQEAVERVRRALLEQRRAMEAAVTDYSAWDDTYDMIIRAPSDPAFTIYFTSNFVPSTFTAKDISGAVFLDNADHVVRNLVYTPGQGKFDSELQLSLESLNPAVFSITYPVTRDNALANSGFSRSNFGPILFALGYIVNSEPPYRRSRGKLLFWRRLDTGFLAHLKDLTQTQIEFFPVEVAQDDVDLTAPLAALKNNRAAFLPRDEKSDLYWLVRDVLNQPLLLFRQRAALRAFDDLWFSYSFLTGFGISAVVLILLVLFFSRNIIRRIEYAEKTMNAVTQTGSYKKRLRLTGNDEIDSMFMRFNQLLTFIQVQEHELKEQNQQLAQLSQQDALTGIPNRRFFDLVLERSWRHCARTRHAMSVLMIDVDLFKAFNDHYGHQAGDHVLKQVAQTLHNHLHRATDYLARYGGEEFAIVLTDTDTESALAVAERLRQAVENLRIRTEVSTCGEVVTVSIGVATANPGSAVVNLEIIKAADDALYQAKAMGRNRVTSLEQPPQIRESDKSAGFSS